MKKKELIKVLIVGSGAFATAIAKVFVDAKKTQVSLFGIDQKELVDLSLGKNLKYFDKTIKLPKFQVSNNLKIALEKINYLVLAVPSVAIKIVVKQILSYLTKPIVLINLAKGFFPNSTDLMLQGIQKFIQNNNYIKDIVSISGPSLANELVLGKHTSLVIITKNQQIFQKIKHLMTTDYLQLYQEKDLIASQVGSIYKNILAIVVGMLQQLQPSQNTIASLLINGLNEMQLLAKALGGRKKTILGLTGLGDLFVTITSKHSRNFQFGQQFVQKGKLALATTKTVEGLNGLQMLNQISKKLKLNLVIVKKLYQIIFQNKNVKQLFNIT